MYSSSTKEWGEFMSRRHVQNGDVSKEKCPKVFVYLYCCAELICPIQVKSISTSYLCFFTMMKPPLLLFYFFYFSFSLFSQFKHQTFLGKILFMKTILTVVSVVLFSSLRSINHFERGLAWEMLKLGANNFKCCIYGFNK